MITQELVQALYEGKGLKKRHYGTYDKKYVVGAEYLYYDVEHDHFQMFGWGTAYGDSGHRLRNLFSQPDAWEIVGSMEDKDWLKED